MATVSVEVSGPDAQRWAGELRAALVAAGPAGDGVWRVEVQRSAELVVAVTGLVLGGVQTAKTVWDWWQARRGEGMTVKVLLEDGSYLDLSGLDEHQLRIEFSRNTQSGN